MRIKTMALSLLLSLSSAPPHAALIGHMTPPEPVTAARIAAMPAAVQPAWQAYLARSQAAMAADKAALAQERSGEPGPPPVPPAHGGEAAMPLDRNPAWYASPEARHLADNILSFQTPAGGWGKNMAHSGPLRLRGQHYVVSEGPNDAWAFVGTIDNDATVTELRFLARVQAQAPEADAARYRAAFNQGIRYLLAAQYPNGGFPQVYPLSGGYHDAITYNDNALAQVIGLFNEIAEHQGDYAFVTAAQASDVLAARDRALRLVVANQVSVGGVRTGWCQQYDALSLAPAGARNFEPIALASGETASLLAALMQIRDPSPEVVAAVHTGIAWLKQVEIHGFEWRKDAETGNHLAAKPGAGPLWARYYDIATMKPLFGDRDRSIHDDVNDLGAERRNGYGWYGTWPGKALRLYEAWSRRHLK